MNVMYLNENSGQVFIANRKFDDSTPALAVREVVCSVLITAYLLDKKSGTNRNLLDKSVAMTQDSIRRVRGLRFQHSINLGAVVLHRFLSEVLPGRSLDVSSRQQVSAEPVLKMLRKEQTDSVENRETVLQDL